MLDKIASSSLRCVVIPVMVSCRVRAISLSAVARWSVSSYPDKGSLTLKSPEAKRWAPRFIWPMGRLTFLETRKLTIAANKAIKNTAHKTLMYKVKSADFMDRVGSAVLMTPQTFPEHLSGIAT